MITATPTLLDRANAGELLTVVELAELLKRPVSWIHDQRRPRQTDPLPAVISKPLTFRWSMIVEWLDRRAEADRKAQVQKRNKPVKRRSRKVVTMPAPTPGEFTQLAAKLGKLYGIPMKSVRVRLSKRG